MSKVSGWSVN